MNTSSLLHLFCLAILAVLFACTPEAKDDLTKIKASNKLDDVVTDNTIVYMPTAIDMGTVVNGKNIKWASFNLGASKPEESGDYFAWAEVEPYYEEGHASDYNCYIWKKGKTMGYNWYSYKWINWEGGWLSRYVLETEDEERYYFYDNKTEFVDYDYEDDAARFILKKQWRTPTVDEWRELIDKCSWTGTFNYNGTKVCGFIVTATNGNSIFLPACGYRSDISLSCRPDEFDHRCDYWSSSLCTDATFFTSQFAYSFSQAYSTDFNPDWKMSKDYRYKGLPIRPVTE